MALRARYGPGNRAWSYQRPAEDGANGPAPLPSAFGLTLEEHTPVPEARIEPDAPTLTAADAARTANGAGRGRARGDGASAARAARSAKASAARSARASGGGGQTAPVSAALGGDMDSAPRRRSGRVPATTAKARGVSPTHTTAPQRTVKRKRSMVAPDTATEAETESESASRPARDGLLPSANDEFTDAELDPTAPRKPRSAGPKRPRVSQKDLDGKPLRADNADDAKRTTFGSTTTAPDPFTALSAADLSSNQDQNAQSQPVAANVENPQGGPLRRLPAGVPVHHSLTGLYRRYPVSQVGLPKEVLAEVPDLDTNVALPPTTIPNATPFLNLYAPRRTRGIGADKHGLCPICAEPPSRGGKGKVMMLNMKTSAFNYHMQYVHGLSPKTGLPFSPPMAFRSSPRKAVGAREKATLEEGLCHACQRWIIVEGVKAVDVLVPEIYWWKHASTCHKSRMLEGEGDFYIEDPLFLRIVQWQRDHPTTTTARETTRTGSAGAPTMAPPPPVVSKEEPMDIDLHQPPVARPGAMTPIRPNQGDLDSSPLSSLDGTDPRVSPLAPDGRKASAPGLQFSPTSRGPFGNASPSAVLARSTETTPVPVPPTGASPFPLGTPQLTNHVLPGTLPGTPQTASSATPVISGVALPAAPQEGAGTDAEAHSVVDSGVALSPRDQPAKHAEGEEDEDADADADAEGEDDPTATAENTPVIAQLPSLPATEPGVEHVSRPEMEQDAAPVVAPAILGLDSIGDNVQPELSMLNVTGVPEVSQGVVQEDVPMPDALIVQPTPIAELDPNPPVTLPDVSSVPQVPDATVPLDLANIGELGVAPVADLPVVQGMDMYAGNATPPNEGETSQLVLTEEDLALASSDLAMASADIALPDVLAGAEMTLVGDESALPGVDLELPVQNLEEALAAVETPAAAPSTTAQNLGGLSSGEGTPNPGGEPDMFAFWNA